VLRSLLKGTTGEWDRTPASQICEASSSERANRPLKKMSTRCVFESSHSQTIGHTGGALKKKNTVDLSAVQKLKARKTPRCDGIRPQVINVFRKAGLHWLTRMCQLTWSFGRAPKVWQTVVISA